MANKPPKSGEIASAFTNEAGCICQPMPLDRILETRDEAREKLKNLLIDLRSRVGLHDFEIGPNKKLDRAINKAKRDYEGDITRVTDFVRAKGIVTTPEQVEEIKTALSEGDGKQFLDDHGIRIVRETDFFESPKDLTGYRCLNYKIAIPIGPDTVTKPEYQVVELQIVAEQIEAVYSTTHPHKVTAEEILNRDEELDRLGRREVAYNYAACRYHNGIAARDAGYDKLLLPEERKSHAMTKSRELKLTDQMDKLASMDEYGQT